MQDKNARPTKYFEIVDYPRQKPKEIDRPVERNNMTDFFIKFVMTDQLGRVVVLYRVLADQKPDGTCDPDCITLTGMHSTPADFSKTGIAVS